MRIQNIRIKNFRSIYGEQEFDFTKLDGLIKLSGVVGSGKTTVGEAIIWGLYGKVKEHKNSNLVAWHTKNNECEVEINLISKNRNINIKRNVSNPLEVRVNGNLLAASNKRDTQEILEEEYYDVPALAVQKMCIISFNAFKNSLASMNPSETRQFLDEIFGFKTFTQYNDVIVQERKIQLNENNQLNTILNETRTQIEHLTTKKEEQKNNIANSVDINALTKKREELVTEGLSYKEQLQTITEKHNTKQRNVEKTQREWYDKKMEFVTLGKQAREWVNKFGEGVCPTCGQEINSELVIEYKNKLDEYTIKYKEYDAKEKSYNPIIQEIQSDLLQAQTDIKNKMDALRKQITDIDSQIKIYNNSIELLNENYDSLISEYKDKITEIEEQLEISDKNISEWNEMNDLFSKTLRYNLLDTLIPHINKSISYYMSKLEQEYTVTYDQEFKPHIFVNDNIKEITYADLSTGQKKTLDIAIIFGVIQNVIANVDFNVFFLDELFSNMDSESRNIMLRLLRETLKENRTIFVVNHADMPDDFFEHKIRVKRENKKIIEKKETIVVKASKYEYFF